MHRNEGGEPTSIIRGSYPGVNWKRHPENRSQGAKPGTAASAVLDGGILPPSPPYYKKRARRERLRKEVLSLRIL